LMGRKRPCLEVYFKIWFSEVMNPFTSLTKHIFFGLNVF
jgi:hypothetical protein